MPVETVFWLVVMVPCSLLITGIGVYAWRRKEPMWFWSGITVKKEEITDVRAYNRANGILWIVFSLIYWAGTVVGVFHPGAAGIVIAAGTFVGVPLLIFGYRRIEAKYRVR